MASKLEVRESLTNMGFTEYQQQSALAQFAHEDLGVTDAEVNDEIQIYDLERVANLALGFPTEQPEEDSPEPAEDTDARLRRESALYVERFVSELDEPAVSRAGIHRVIDYFVRCCRLSDCWVPDLSNTITNFGSYLFNWNLLYFRVCDPETGEFGPVQPIDLPLKTRFRELQCYFGQLLLERSSTIHFIDRVRFWCKYKDIKEIYSIDHYGRMFVAMHQIDELDAEQGNDPERYVEIPDDLYTVDVCSLHDTHTETRFGLTVQSPIIVDLLQGKDDSCGDNWCMHRKYALKQHQFDQLFFRPGDIIEAIDEYGKWFEGVVRCTKQEMDEDTREEYLSLAIHFIGWKSRWDEWIKIPLKKTVENKSTGVENDQKEEENEPGRTNRTIALRRTNCRKTHRPHIPNHDSMYSGTHVTKTLEFSYTNPRGLCYDENAEASPKPPNELRHMNRNSDSEISDSESFSSSSSAMPPLEFRKLNKDSDDEDDDDSSLSSSSSSSSSSALILPVFGDPSEEEDSSSSSS